MGISFMNNLKAIVTGIEHEGNVHIVQFDFHGESLSMMGLDLPIGLHVGSTVLLGAKPSHIAIAKNLQGDLSYSNQLSATIASMEEGRLLVSFVLHVKDARLQSFITKRSCERMKLACGDAVSLLIKASELFILEVIDE